VLCVLPKFNEQYFCGIFSGISTVKPSLKVEAECRRDCVKNGGESGGLDTPAQQGFVSSLSSLERKPQLLFRCPECDALVSRLVLDLFKRKYVCEICQESLSGLEVYRC
jgi:hypothetical protein